MKRVRKGRVRITDTPVRKALRADSPLHENVANGLGAVMSAHRDHFDTSVRPEFTDSLDIDEAFKFGREQEHRWDYLVGHAPSGRIVGVEPHSAENSEITTVVMKVRAARATPGSFARRRIRGEMAMGCFGKGAIRTDGEGEVYIGAKWYPVAPMEKARFTLAQNGIQFVGRRVTNKHLKK